MSDERQLGESAMEFVESLAAAMRGVNVSAALMALCAFSAGVHVAADRLPHGGYHLVWAVPSATIILASMRLIHTTMRVVVYGDSAIEMAECPVSKVRWQAGSVFCGLTALSRAGGLAACAIVLLEAAL